MLSKITGKLSDFGISIEKMFQNVQAGAEGAATVVIVSHKAREGDVRKALRELDPMQHTVAPARLLRILA